MDEGKWTPRVIEGGSEGLGAVEEAMFALTAMGAPRVAMQSMFDDEEEGRDDGNIPDLSYERVKRAVLSEDTSIYKELFDEWVADTYENEEKLRSYILYALRRVAAGEAYSKSDLPQLKIPWDKVMLNVLQFMDPEGKALSIVSESSKDAATAGIHEAARKVLMKFLPAE